MSIRDLNSLSELVRRSAARYGQATALASADATQGSLTYAGQRPRSREARCSQLAEGRNHRASQVYMAFGQTIPRFLNSWGGAPGYGNEGLRPNELWLNERYWV